MIPKEQQEAQRQALDPDTLLAEARRRADLTDFGDESFMVPLRRMLECCAQDVNFHEAGLKDTRETTIRELVNRLRIEDDIKRHPEILDEDVSDPIILLGLPRSGTTKTHRSIGSDPRLLKTFFWQLINPARFPNAVPGEPDPRIEGALGQDRLLEDNAAIRAAHLYGVQEIQTDMFLQGFTFNAEFNCMGGRMYSPSFVAWLRQREFPSRTDNYRYVRKIVQYLQWQQGGGEGRRWLFKNEGGIGDLDAITEVYPNATLVHLHRDPRITMASNVSIASNVMPLRVADVDVKALGRYHLERTGGVMARYLDLRDRLGLDDRIMDIHYEDVRKKPIEVAEKIYERAGFPMTEEAREAMRQWEAGNEQHKHGEHRYSLEQFGLSVPMIEEVFGPYLERFGKFIERRA